MGEAERVCVYKLTGIVLLLVQLLLTRLCYQLGLCNIFYVGTLQQSGEGSSQSLTSLSTLHEQSKEGKYHR